MRSFFGLNDNYAKDVYETFFLLKYHGNWGFAEAYGLPVMIRNWFLERLVRQFKQEREQAEKSSNGKNTHYL